MMKTKEGTLSNRDTRHHKLYYRQLQTNVLSYSYSLFPREVRIGNNKPPEAVYAASLPAFRAAASQAIPHLKVPSHLKRL